jgi:hypothetical protein
MFSIREISKASLSSKGIERIRTALKKTGYLIPNQSEFKSLTGSYDDDIITPSEVRLKSDEEMRDYLVYL